MKTIHEIKATIESMPDTTRRAMNVLMAHVAAGAPLFALSVKHSDPDTYLYPKALGKRVITTLPNLDPESWLSTEQQEETVHWTLDGKNNPCGYETGYLQYVMVPTGPFVELFGDLMINVKQGRIQAADGAITFNVYLMKQIVWCMKAERLPSNARQAAAMGLPTGLFA